MKSINTGLMRKLGVASLISCTLATSSIGFAQKTESLQDPSVSLESQLELENEIMPLTTFIEGDSINSLGGEYGTKKFTTTAKATLNVFFDNKGTKAVTLQLYKDGIFKDTLVNDMPIPASKGDTMKTPALAKGTYYVKIKDATGGKILGTLRIRSLD